MVNSVNQISVSIHIRSWFRPFPMRMCSFLKAEAEKLLREDAVEDVFIQVYEDDDSFPFFHPLCNSRHHVSLEQAPWCSRDSV